MKRFDQINVVPFIDIMLVLLCIVLTTASFVQMGELQVALPSSKQRAAPPSAEAALEIELDVDGVLYVHGERLSWEVLEKRIVALEQGRRILLSVDENTVFQRFVDLVDLLKHRPRDQISIRTRASS